ncbi:MAG: PAS domain-containing sensor histidine kinase [Chitinophagaceae bacterium]|nr:MAG: PAS domain-containing sensor histidine kinase [Chitinophagaceae bacterium]
MDARLANAPCLYFVTSDDGIVLDVNEALCLKLGYRADELIGQRSEIFSPPATRIFQQTHLFPLLRMQGFAEEIFIHLRPRSGDDLPLLINAQRTGDPAEIHYAGIVVRHRKEFEEDLIAARKAAEKALRENSELQEAQEELRVHSEQLDLQMERTNRQNTELRQFNRVVTHDVQEPLRKLQVFSNMLVEDAFQEQQHPLVEKICRATRQLRDVIAGLQQYVWLNDAPLRVAPVEIAPMLRAIAARVEKEFPDVRLQLEAPEQVIIPADREQLHWLLHELLSNAVRFRKDPESAQVRVFYDSVHQNRFRNVEGRYAYAEYGRLRIEDQGQGFDPVYTEQAFELFKRLHPNSGRGIGLALCRKIMDHHSGLIRIESLPGVGTSITLLFPLEGTKGPDSAVHQNSGHVPTQTHTDR